MHDDASSDGTTVIIREYARKYPDIVIPIIEKENCVQRGKQIRPIIKEAIRGKYVALCECDDWWTDQNKLQLQWEYMELHRDCSLHVHGVNVFREKEGSYRGCICPSKKERDYDIDEIILGDGGLFGTNSMFLPNALFVLPREYLNWGVGDYPTAIYLATQGTVHFNPRVMSSYRAGSAGSWSERMLDSAYAIATRERLIQCLGNWDVTTNFKHHSAVSKRILLWRLENASLTGQKNVLSSVGSTTAFKTLTAKQRIKYWLKIAHPKVFALIKDLMNIRHAKI